MPLDVTPDDSNALGFYVYAFVDPRDESVFYIGKGVVAHTTDHLSNPAAGRTCPSTTLNIHRLPSTGADGPPYSFWMLSHGPTLEEAAIVSQHLTYLKRLTEQGVVILAGPTLNTDASRFGIVILQAHSEEAACDIMHNDPAVQHRVMRAELYPYRIALAAKAPGAATESAPCSCEFLRRKACRQRLTAPDARPRPLERTRKCSAMSTAMYHSIGWHGIIALS